MAGVAIQRHDIAAQTHKNQLCDAHGILHVDAEFSITLFDPQLS